MQLNNLIHWRLQGTPDVFTEKRAGETWTVIDSSEPYRAGLAQVVEFDRLVDQATLSAKASFFTQGALNVRIGIDSTGNLNPEEASVDWSGWTGTDHGWTGGPAILAHTSFGFQTKTVIVFLEAAGRWPNKNTSRWRDVQLEVEYADSPEPEPNPDPNPEPNPDTPEAIRVLQQAMTLSSQLLEQASKMTVAIGKVLALFDQDPEV